MAKLPQYTREVDAHEKAQRRAKEKGDQDRLEHGERKLIADAELEIQRSAPPTEPSTSMAPAEVAKREELQWSHETRLGVRMTEEQIQQRDRRRHALRDHRVREHVAKEAERNGQHMQRVQPQVAKLEKAIAELEAQRTQLLERQAGERAEVDGALAEQGTKLSGLVRALEPGETSEQRVEAVMGS